LWRSPSVNAQAYRLGPLRRVRLYGGLARHRALGPEGLALAVAHEIGHHEAGPPFDGPSSWMSSDERADRWVVQSGLPRLWGKAAARKLLAVGIAQLSAVVEDCLRLSDTAMSDAAWAMRRQNLHAPSDKLRLGAAASCGYHE
jgi:hypothetical protein